MTALFQGIHAPGRRHIYDHAYHSRRSQVLNASGRPMSSEQVRGVLNSSRVALNAPHGQPLKVGWVGGRLVAVYG